MPQHPDWVPEGRDRLGFDYWRAYNQHMVYFNGFVHSDDWNYERWERYETDGVLNYGIEFMDNRDDDPFLLCLSPHPPHYTPYDFAPPEFYEGLPDVLELPANVPEHQLEASRDMCRHYLAIILAVDAMLGKLLAYLDANWARRQHHDRWVV